MRRVAVVGGGPAGAFAAERLASAGLEVLLFDEKLAWEKPCGGGLTCKAYRRYPFLLENPTPKRLVHELVFAAAAGEVRLRTGEPLVIYSRRDLNGMLLDRAARAGACLEKERVLRIERAAGGWRLRTRGGEAHADYVIVANGARNALRGLGTEPVSISSLLAMGYFVPARQEHLVVQFFDTFEGYIWVFPRSEHLSVGICGRGEPAHALRRRLEAYMDAHGIPLEGATFYGHLLPTWNPGRFSGDGWMAVGDAAGMVDPITGEGIYYALRSADLAAEALLSSAHPETTYAASVRADFGADLDMGAALARRFFAGTFARRPVTSRMVQFARRSRRFGALLEDLVAGAQGYVDLRRRCYAELPRILLDMVTFR